MVVKYVNLTRMVLVHFGCFWRASYVNLMCVVVKYELDMYGSIALCLLLEISYVNYTCMAVSCVNYVHLVENCVICVVIYMLSLSIYIVMLSFLKIQTKCCRNFEFYVIPFFILCFQPNTGTEPTRNGMDPFLWNGTIPFHDSWFPNQTHP